VSEFVDVGKQVGLNLLGSLLLKSVSGFQVASKPVAFDIHVDRS
jgi:hypothetical protein